MRKLTDEDKINILKYEVGVYALANIDDYAEISRFPKSPDKEWEPQDVFISDVLGLNFRKEIYDNKELLMNKEHKEFLKEKGCSWGFLGDAIMDTFASYCIAARDADQLIDIDSVNEVTQKILEVYNYYLEFKAKENEPKFIPSGIFMNNEELYRKVINE